MDPWLGKIPWRRTWQPTQVVLPGKSHGQGSLAGYSSRGSQRVGHDLVTKQQQSSCAGSAPMRVRHSQQTADCDPGKHLFLWPGQHTSKPHSSTVALPRQTLTDTLTPWAHLCLRAVSDRGCLWRRAVEGAPSGQAICLGAPEADS